MKNVNIENEVKKFDYVFIGGGPATLGFIANLFQSNNNDKFFQHLNILIIEKSNAFGSGCLGSYGINTNTSSEGFARIICNLDKDKSGKLALSPSRKALKNSRNFIKKLKVYKIEAEIPIYRPLNIFREIYDSATVKTLLAIGNRPAPLTLVGNFLETVGNFILDYIFKVYSKKIFLANNFVKKIKMNSSDDYTIFVEDSNFNISHIRSKHIILASGGLMQKPSLFDEIKFYKSNAFLSNDLLKQEGYSKFKNLCNEIKNPKIVIIGGSHSGFSCAWIILNSFPSYSKIGEELTTKRLQDCNKLTCIQNSCFCFGSVNDKNWNIETSKLKEFDIQILYRDFIKVFYSNEEEAENNQYKLFNRKEALNKQGKVYPFIGLRGDAKELYHNIMKGEEKRVKLVKTKSEKEQLDIIKDADIIIWACGYSTNSIPFIDNKGSIIEFNTDTNQLYTVDKSLHLTFKNKTQATNIFGIGQGYSTLAPEIINGKPARADSINLYNTNIASKLYKSIEPFLNKQILIKPLINDKRSSVSQKRMLDYFSIKPLSNTNTNTNTNTNNTNSENNLNEDKSLALFNKTKLTALNRKEENLPLLNKRTTFENKNFNNNTLSRVGNNIVSKNFKMTNYGSNLLQSKKYSSNMIFNKFNKLENENQPKNLKNIIQRLDYENLIKNKLNKK